MRQLTQKELENHKKTAKKLYYVKEQAFKYIERRLEKQEVFTELDVQTYILSLLQKEGLTTDEDKPIVAINDHCAEPHYFVNEKTNAVITRDALVLLDIWARTPGGIYADITWMGFTGRNVPKDHKECFEHIIRARETAIHYIEKHLREEKYPIGHAVDHVARDVIKRAGYGDYFIHNLGHSIDEAVHGKEVNLRGYTEKENRHLHKGLLFSIEPGIYLPGEAGYRTEINAYINKKNKLVITGKKRQETLQLLG